MQLGPQNEDYTCQINIKSRNQYQQSPEQLTIDSLISCNASKIQQMQSRLINAGIDNSIFSNQQPILIFQLYCNPGQQAQVSEEINKMYASQEQPTTIFQKIIRHISYEQIKIDTFIGQAKVFVKLNLNNDHKHTKTMRRLQKIKDIDNTLLHFVLKGERIINLSNQNQTKIRYNGIQLNIKSTAAKQFGLFIKSMIQQFGQNSYPLFLLTELSSARINITSTSLQRFDQLFEFKWQQYFNVSSQSKKIIQNQFKFWFGLPEQYLSQSTIKIDSPSLFLKQMHKNVWKKIK